MQLVGRWCGGVRLALTRNRAAVAAVASLLMNSCRAKANLLETDELDELRN
jgi:hypothetical protein